MTDASGMLDGASSFLQDIDEWTFADNADTTGMFTGADTWLSRASRDDTVNTTDGPPGAWVFNPCLENERVENGVCAPCTGGGTRAAGDDPALGVDTGCTFPDSAALKAAVDNCIAVDPTGVACCSHGADCGAAGTVEMAGLGRVAGDEHEQLVQWQSILQRGYIAVGRQLGHEHVRTCFLKRRRVQPAPVEMGRQLGHDMQGCSTDATAFNTMPVGWDTSKVTIYRYFIRATAWNARFTGGDDNTLPERLDAHRQRVRRVSSAPQRRRRQLHRHPRERHVLRPHVRRRVRAGGRDVVHRPGTDRGCVYPGRHHQGRAQGGGGRVRRRSAVRGTMPHWDVSRVTDMSFLFQGKSQFNVDISQWEMSQVTDRGGYVSGRLQLLPDISGWTFADNAEHDGDVHGRRHLARVLHSRRRARHGGWTARCLGLRPVPGERTRR